MPPWPILPTTSSFPISLLCIFSYYHLHVISVSLANNFSSVLFRGPGSIQYYPQPHPISMAVCTFYQRGACKFGGKDPYVDYIS